MAELKDSLSDMVAACEPGLDRLCKDCRWCNRGGISKTNFWTCGYPDMETMLVTGRDFVAGERREVYCGDARGSKYSCGRDGDHWEPVPVPAAKPIDPPAVSVEMPRVNVGGGYVEAEIEYAIALRDAIWAMDTRDIRTIFIYLMGMAGKDPWDRDVMGVAELFILHTMFLKGGIL